MKGMLTVSGAITTIVILLIVVFLFKEGIGLFSTPAVEKGYALYVNAANPVNSLSVTRIKHIFDQEVSNWNSVGGSNEEIKIYRIDDIVNLFSEEELGENYSLLPYKVAQVLSADKGAIAYLPAKYAPVGAG